ncbi:MAG: MIP/aquaporin family protein [Bacteroidota bacterium]
MSNFIAEFIGTALLLLLGNGVVCNVVLNQTKGNNAGWIVITAGWGMAVFVAVFTVAPYSGAHLNPAVSLGLATAGVFEWGLVPIYVLAQMLGAATGTTLAWLMYRPHVEATPDPGAKLAIFATGPAIPKTISNFYSEILGTFVLVFAALSVAPPEMKANEFTNVEFGLGALGALPIGLVVFAIGMSLGGTTGYAINPARDLAPRIMHAILPMSNKGSSDWGYSWIPVIGPILGGILAGVLYAVLVN